MSSTDKNIKTCPECNEKIITSYENCPKCGHELLDIQIKPPKVSKLLKFQREKLFLSNYDFNLKTCPECNSKILLSDSFCHNCGLDVANFKPQKTSAKPPVVSKVLKFKRKAIFLSNYDFNLKECFECKSKLLTDDLYCYNCGKKVE